ncbi:Holliday junction branch migration protein RuvA, partial [Candidatus Nomurabacteria bacterium]|nr:Holliday junction branch migration protein RuvA [Candidatus Nomurabacteria bacterium]
RIVVELKDKIKGASFDNVSARSLTGGDIVSSETGRSKYNEACSALVVLGYSVNEANSAVTAVYNDEIGVEQIIKLALKELI